MPHIAAQYTYVGKHRKHTTPTTRKFAAGTLTLATAAMSGGGIAYATTPTTDQAREATNTVHTFTQPTVSPSRVAQVSPQASKFLSQNQQASDIISHLPDVPNLLPDDARNVANQGANMIDQGATLVDKGTAVADNTRTQVSNALQGQPAAPQLPTLNKGQRTTIVNTALAQLGKPYVWGGNGPDVFDCSGLVKYAYHVAGIDLPRTAYSQAMMGSQVSEAVLRPGDVVGYSNGGHIAIYIGDGKVVHAPQEGDVVKVSSLHMMPVWRMSSIAG